MHVVRPPEQPDRRRDGVAGEQRRRALELRARQLQPELGRLVDGLEQVLVVMHDLVAALSAATSSSSVRR